MPRRKARIGLSDIHEDLRRVAPLLSVIDARLSNLQTATTNQNNTQRSFPNIPPKWVFEAACANMKRTNHWIEYYHVLTDWYGISRIGGAYIDSTIKPETVAEYRYASRTVYSRANDMNEHTALHELWHHLVYMLKLTTNGESEQALANAFADACLKVQQAA